MEETDIDFIKWMCDKAEGFEINLYYGDIGIVYKTLLACNSEEISEIHNEPIKKILLQSAIEGVIKEHGIQFDLYYNKKTESWDMMFFNKKNLNYKDSWGLLPHEGNVSSDYKTAVSAKESALKYIYEQEKK